MRKLLSTLLVLAMVLTLAVPAFATGIPTDPSKTAAKVETPETDGKNDNKFVRDGESQDFNGKTEFHVMVDDEGTSPDGPTTEGTEIVVPEHPDPVMPDPENPGEVIPDPGYPGGGDTTDTVADDDHMILYVNHVATTKTNALAATVPLYVSMYAYAADGKVVVPAANAYSISNDSILTTVKNIVAVDEYRQVVVIDEDTVIKDTAHPDGIEIVGDFNKNGGYGYYLNAEGKNIAVVVNKCVDLVGNGKLYSFVKTHTNGDKVPDSLKDVTSYEGLAMEVAKVKAQGDHSWTLVDGKQMLAKELFLSVNGLDMSTVLDTTSILDLQWKIDAPELEQTTEAPIVNTNKVTASGILPLPLKAAIAGGNVNAKMPNTTVAQVTYTLAAQN